MEFLPMAMVKRQNPSMHRDITCLELLAPPSTEIVCLALPPPDYSRTRDFSASFHHASAKRCGRLADADPATATRVRTGKMAVAGMNPAAQRASYLASPTSVLYLAGPWMHSSFLFLLEVDRSCAHAHAIPNVRVGYTTWVNK